MLRNIYFFFFYMGLVTVVGCAGYHVKKNNNPWAKFGVKHVTVPLFQNDSLLPGINNSITSGIIQELQKFSGLEVSVGENRSADAMLLGIIHGSNKLNAALVTKERIYLDDSYDKSLGERRGIYLPRQQSYSIIVDLYLIQHPTTYDLKLLRSKLGKFAQRHPKIIFSRSLSVTQSIVRSLWKRDTEDNGGVVNYTQSEGTLRRSFKVAADDIVRQFREMVLYAF